MQTWNLAKTKQNKTKKEDIVMMDWNSPKKRFWILSHFDAGIHLPLFRTTFTRTIQLNLLLQIILWSCSTACLIQVFIYYIKRLDSTVDSINLYLPVGRPLQILLNFLQWIIWCCHTYFKLSYHSSKRLFENSD